MKQIEATRTKVQNLQRFFRVRLCQISYQLGVFKSVFAPIISYLEKIPAETLNVYSKNLSTVDFYGFCY